MVSIAGVVHGDVHKVTTWAFNITADPTESHNLAGNPAFKEHLDALISFYQKYQVQEDPPRSRRSAAVISLSNLSVADSFAD